MIEIIAEMLDALILLLASPFNQGMKEFALKFIPYVLFLEVPIYILIFLGILRYCIRKDTEIPEEINFYPRVTCIVTCYSEGRNVALSIRSLMEQIYPGVIEIMPVIDGAFQNRETYQTVKQLKNCAGSYKNRIVKMIPKWKRGGKVSSLNLGLKMATGEVIMALDGETSFDNNMVRDACAHFADPNVVGVAGSLRVRNAFKNLITRLQAFEYMLSIHASKVGLGEFNVVNNISGALGIFRKTFLERVGGWDSGTAEDLDLTLRMKNYFGRNPNLKINFEPKAMGHTDAPETFRDLFKQRLRWDGDLYYLYIRKHSLAFNPRQLGWRNLTLQLWTGLFFQLVMPFVLILYTIYIFVIYPIEFVLAVCILIYFLYFGITLLFYLLYVTFLSERPLDDLRLIWVIPLVPFYAFALRVWNAASTLLEMFGNAHMDSTMAPWWVLKKTKF